MSSESFEIHKCFLKINISLTFCIPSVKDMLNHRKCLHNWRKSCIFAVGKPGKACLSHRHKLLGMKKGESIHPEPIRQAN